MSGKNSYLVGAGILLSRLSGLVRQKVLAHFLGLGDVADAFAAAFRIPNLLQNLFGEGALSASFIPGYSRLLGEEREEEARKLAGAVLALLAMVVAVIVLIGQLATPLILDLLVGDWTGEKRALTETLVRILFPGAGLLVISAWCLGVLNSHRRFLLSYAAPVVWNATMIISIIVFGAGQGAARVAVVAAWGSVAGSFLQIVAQWPVVRRVGGRIAMRSWRGVNEVGVVVRTFLPTMISRGANQLSAFIDLTIAAFLPGGAVAAIAAAQVLYTLPVSLFGMAISAAELPEMAREQGDTETVAMALRVRLDAATQRLAYYIVPSAMAFLAIGGVLIGAVYQGGKFTAADTAYVWLVLGGATIGLLAATLARLYASAFYALRDAVTPLRTGLVRVTLTGILGVLGALVVPRMLGLPSEYGAVGITVSAGISGWVEFSLLRRSLCRRLGNFSVPLVELAKLWGAATVAAAIGTAMRLLTTDLPPITQALLVVPAYGATYVAVTWWLDVPESAVIARRLRRSERSPQ